MANQCEEMTIYTCKNGGLKCDCDFAEWYFYYAVLECEYYNEESQTCSSLCAAEALDD